MRVAASTMDILQGADATLYRPSFSVLDLLGFGFWVFHGFSGVIELPIWGGSTKTKYKCMVILRDFFCNSALFELVIY